MAKFILPILSGVLLTLAYPPYDLEFLAWVALIPLLWFLSLKSVSIKKALIGGTIFGVLFFGKLFSWLFAAAPFDWLGITQEKTAPVFIILIILWIIQTVFLGLFFGVFSWFLKLSFKNFSKLSFLIIIPALWIILEYLRAWGFSILWLGKESLLGPHWTFGNLAYTLHSKITLIQIADIAGIYGISFLIVFVNVALFLIFKKKNWIILVILVLVALTWSGYGVYKSKSYEVKPHKVKIALLQTNFSSSGEFNPYQKKEVFKTIVDLFQTPNKADIIIAPEGFGIVSLTGDLEIAKYLLKDFWQKGQIYLENEKVIEKEKVKSRLFYYDLNEEEPIAFHDKMLLVPNGEFLPYLSKALLSIYSFDMMKERRFYEQGEKIKIGKTPKGNIGGTICSSILSPSLQRQMTKKGAEFLVVVSSDAPFHGSKTLLAQNLAMSKLRAVENRRYFAQTTNMGYSFLLNPKGETIIKGSKLGNKILFGDIYLSNKKTIYTKFGDWIIIFALILILSTIPLTPVLWYNKESS